MPSSTKRGPYAKTAARQREILDAAGDVFATHGYRAGSLKEIADRVGIDASTILHHFANKSVLLQKVLEDRDTRSLTDADPDRTAGPADTPAAFLRLARANEKIPGIVELYTLLAAESATPDHPSNEYFVLRYARVRSEFASAFREMADAGLLRPGVDPEFAAVSTLALWDGVQVQWMHDPDAVDVTETLRKHLELLTTVDLS
ncbi:AcrR family transcriptional regulator [Microbacterium sp. SORGH_AS 505]|uniref:TetR/AcrR family transcriptional regulator n=1 Tax=Microbacterium sp. SORGH_AS_0505 TaxID=3041770 RepID=UPI002780DB5C|nr:TetR/AcrR family transcriptional regulator [Microbacterium sp. SORGH_AS_0505]MDQ1125017.1 AcrR family transcriptional regulator [Microbacterium sp. SORGH_AS_0505]